MKSRIVHLMLVLCLLALVVVPAQVAYATDAPQTAPPEPPVLPDAVQLVIGAAVTFLVVAGLKDFLEFTGHDLTGWGTVIAAAVTATVIYAINMAIQVAVTIDPTVAPKVNAFFQILVILLGAMGFKRLQRANSQGNVGTKQESSILTE